MTRTTQSLPFSRWWLVIVGAMIMGIAGTFQFLWSSIRGPIGVQIGASEATLGTLFTVLIAAQTLSQFPAGWFRDRFGPRLPLFSSGILFAGGYIGLTLASSFVHAVIAVIFGGIGSGIAYTVAVNTPVKWFDEHRGIATGIVAMSYSGLSFVLIPVVRGNIVGSFDSTLFIFGGIGAITALVGAIILRDPTSTTQTTTTDTAEPNTEVSYTWRETIQTWQFWLLYGIFIIVNGVGLMLIGKVISFA
ncbi:MAG: MFS transporter, partial [Halobacteriaceae archaeon]